MNRPWLNQLIGLLCLVALGVQAGAAAWMVRCSHVDSHGVEGSHLEWGGCATGGDGCVASCDDHGSDGRRGADGPCQDDPIGSDDGLVAPRAGARLVVIEACVMPLPIPEVVVESARAERELAAFVERRVVKPPLVLASLKTVVLVV